MKPLLILVCVAALPGLAATDWPTGDRTTPPIIYSVSPRGVARGVATELTIEGLNLAHANAVFFSERGVQARILRIKELPDQPEVRLGENGTVSTVDVGALPPRNEVTLELTVAADAAIGPVAFRLQTPLGTSPVGRFLIEPYYGEAADSEPNDTPDAAVDVYPPAILVGTIFATWATWTITKSTPQPASNWYSQMAHPTSVPELKPVVGIYNADRELIWARVATGCSSRTPSTKKASITSRSPTIAKPAVRSTFIASRSAKFPWPSFPAYPLGVAKGKTARVTLAGYNLGAAPIDVPGEPSPHDERSLSLRPSARGGKAFNEITLAIGREPGKSKLNSPQHIPITAPVTINGKLRDPENDFHFTAHKGEKLIFEVNANRLGSPLDSLLEVLDAHNKPVEQATVRCVLATGISLADRDSASSGLRVLSAAGFAVGDIAMSGGELIRVRAMPPRPRR